MADDRVAGSLAPFGICIDREDIGDKQSQTGGQLLYEPHQGLHPGWKN
ncbi:MAG: hypothetical protein WAP07_08350 [Acutalibacteraceae bacterium]